MKLQRLVYNHIQFYYFLFNIYFISKLSYHTICLGLAMHLLCDSVLSLLVFFKLSLSNYEIGVFHSKAVT